MQKQKERVHPRRLSPLSFAPEFQLFRSLMLNLHPSRSVQGLFLSGFLLPVWLSCLWRPSLPECHHLLDVLCHGERYLGLGGPGRFGSGFRKDVFKEGRKLIAREFFLGNVGFPPETFRRGSSATGGGTRGSEGWNGSTTVGFGGLTDRRSIASLERKEEEERSSSSSCIPHLTSTHSFLSLRSTAGTAVPDAFLKVRETLLTGRPSSKTTLKGEASFEGRGLIGIGTSSKERISSSSSKI